MTVALAKMSRWVMMLAFIAVLAGCAGDIRSEKPVVDKESVVARMAQARWDALRQGDVESAYKVLSPAIREVMTLDGYRRKVGLVRWTSASVKEVGCQAADVCAVAVEAKYQYMPRYGALLENTQMLTETWRLIGNEWWYAPADLL